MSDQPPRTRRSALRIMPIGPVESSSAAQRTASAFKPLSTRPAIRARSYGAPLISGSRPVGPRDKPEDRTVADNSTVSNDTHPVNSNVSTVGRTSNSTALAAQPEILEEAVFWDQPPRPESEIDEEDMLPPWVSDVSMSPTEAQFHELGTYLTFMALSFADFCRSQAIVESGQWQGRMKMPQKILPETVLQLEVSAFHAMLRFETEHPVSREILKRHCEALREEVSAALGGSRPVEVSTW